MSADSAAPAIERIGQIAVPIRDLESAVSFYRDTLGLTLLFQAPPGLAFFDCGGVRLMLSLPESDAPSQPASIVYYLVPDLQAAWAALSEHAAKGVGGAAEPHLIAKMPDHDLWMAFVEDGQGNTLGLMSEVRPPAP